METSGTRGTERYVESRVVVVTGLETYKGRTFRRTVRCAAPHPGVAEREPDCCGDQRGRGAGQVWVTQAAEERRQEGGRPAMQET